MILNGPALNTVNVNSAGFLTAENLYDLLGIADACGGFVVSPLVDFVAISGVIGSNAVYTSALSDELSIRDILTTVLLGEVTDNAVLSDTVASFATLVGEVTDALILSDIYESRVSAIGAIADMLLVSAEAKQFYAGFTDDELRISDAIDSRVNLIGALTDVLNCDDVAVPYIRLYGVATDSAIFTDELTARVRLIGAIEDCVVFSAILRLPDGEYLAYVVNTKTLATTKYTNFPFNSFASLNGLSYGLTDTGLYELSGDTDDGADIDAVIKSAFSNLGTSLLKNIPRVYIGYKTDGRLVLKTITSQRGRKVERWYQLASRTADTYREARIQLARGVQSVYWQFELVNTDGADFAIDTLQVLPLVLDRRIG